MSHTNMILFGDLNLEFKTAAEKRAEINRLRSFNQGELGSTNAALVNFPLLSVHTDRQHLPNSEQLFRTNARSSQTYDQIAFFVHTNELCLPLPSNNKIAVQHAASSYDYGVFRFTDLVAQALDREPDYNNLSRARRDFISRRVNAEFSDHLPTWTRIPLR